MLASLILLLSACNRASDKDTSDLYAKSTTRESIVERSGTTFRAGTNKEDLDRQFDDAQNRLRTGGGLFGKKAGIDIFSSDDKSEQTYSSIGLPINPYLWKGALETINFMPLLSADPFSGIIITEWYTDNQNPNERCKLNIYIKGVELKTSNLKVNSFCQNLSETGNWIDKEINKKNNAQIENAILNKAKKIKLAQT